MKTRGWATDGAIIIMSPHGNNHEMDREDWGEGNRWCNNTVSD